MITKISNIDNFAVFNNFDWDKQVVDSNGKPLKFEKLNIIYGRNYSGKTTLSRIIRSLETGLIDEKCGSPTYKVLFDDDTNIDELHLSACNSTVRVFNDDFIKSNLRFIINSDEKIEPFAILGDDNDVVINKINIITQELGINEPNKQTGLYADYSFAKRNMDKATEELKTTLDRLEKLLASKATSRDQGIKYKTARYADPNYNISKLNSDIAIVTSTEYKPLQISTVEEYELLLNEQAKPIIPPLNKLILSFDTFCLQAEKLLSRKICNSNKILELLTNVALNDWVKHGFHLHNHERINCAFCGNYISDERWSQLYAHFDEESKILESDINQLLEQLEKEKNTVKKAFIINKTDFYTKYATDLEQLQESYILATEIYINNISLIVNQLEKRKNTITETFNFSRPANNSSDLLAVLSNYESLRNKSDSYSKELMDDKKNARRQLLLQEVYEFCLQIGYKDIMHTVKELQNTKTSKIIEYNSIQENIITKKRELEEYKQALNDEEKGAQRVNEYLDKYFGHSFISMKPIKQEIVGGKSIYFEVTRNHQKAYNLSEGECSLIAFCYFMAKLDDVDTRDAKPIIWIDDPISSLDGNHIFFVYSLLAAELTDNVNFEQLFISTHNLDFLKYLRRLKYFENKEGKRKEGVKQYFMISRHFNNSRIEKLPHYLKEYGTEYNYLFQCIYKCSQITVVDDSNYEIFYNFGNNARKFLEIYLYYKYPDNSEDKINRFFGEEKVPALLTERINNEYSHLKGCIERGAFPVEIPEMSSVAHLIINKLKQDSDQFNALLNSIGVVFPTS